MRAARTLVGAVGAVLLGAAWVRHGGLLLAVAALCLVVGVVLGVAGARTQRGWRDWHGARGAARTARRATVTHLGVLIRWALVLVVAVVAIGIAARGR